MADQLATLPGHTMNAMEHALDALEKSRRRGLEVEAFLIALHQGVQAPQWQIRQRVIAMLHEQHSHRNSSLAEKCSELNLPDWPADA